MIREGAFAEWAEVYNHLYGTSLSSLKGHIDQGRDVLMDVDSQGARNIRVVFKESTLIYILPPSVEILRDRLLGRATDDGEVIEERMKRSLKELEDCLWYDYLIINNDLETAADKAAAIITAQRCLARNTYNRVKRIFHMQ
jgi:guanylate kinase